MGLIQTVDIIISLAWFAAFGVLVDALGDLSASCGGLWHWSNLTANNDCSRWKAAEAFSFLSACFWLASGLLVRPLTHFDISLYHVLIDFYC
jgi:Membrane-associating domain